MTASPSYHTHMHTVRVRYHYKAAGTNTTCSAPSISRPPKALLTEHEIALSNPFPDRIHRSNAVLVLSKMIPVNSLTSLDN